MDCRSLNIAPLRYSLGAVSIAAIISGAMWWYGYSASYCKNPNLKLLSFLFAWNI